MTRTDKAMAERARTVFYMVAVTFVCTSAVSALHLVTADRVKANAAMFMKRAVRTAAGLPPAPPAELEAWFASNVVRRGADDFAVARGADGAPVDARVRSGAGLWGRITAVVGVNRNTGAIQGVAFIEQNETPGLGARIDEPWFTAQLPGRRAPLRFLPERTRSEDPTAFDGITGATITTRAVADILNRTLGENAAPVSHDAGGTP